ncbi:hypothetical protein ANO11243_093800 [Dothideomycetidae sp. 11243]|nr:hypothetical protein ANO11243_093800 [fungal sp. No.11243]
MHLALITLFASLAMISAKAVSSTPSLATCKANDAYLKQLKKHVTDPKSFCSFYLAMPETQSALPGQTAAQLTQSCQCFFVEQSLSVPKTQAVTTFPEGNTFVCYKKAEAMIKKAFSYAPAFCKYYQDSRRNDSPIAGLAGMHAHQGCACMLPPSVQQTAASPSTTTTSSTSAGPAGCTDMMPAVTSFTASDAALGGEYTATWSSYRNTSGIFGFADGFEHVSPMPATDALAACATIVMAQQPNTSVAYNLDLFFWNTTGYQSWYCYWSFEGPNARDTNLTRVDQPVECLWSYREEGFAKVD